jgi:hypothetical protein
MQKIQANGWAQNVKRVIPIRWSRRVKVPATIANQLKTRGFF